MTEGLLATLEGRANTRGLVLVTEGALSEAIAAAPEALGAELGKLERAGLIELFSPRPFFVIRLKMWPGHGSGSKKNAPKTRALANRAYSFQSYLSQSKRLNESYRGPEAKTVAARNEPLLQEILDTLGETDPTTFRGALRSYPPGVIRTALEKVRLLKHIQKSRTAAFRFLLPRIAKETASIK